MIFRVVHLFFQQSVALQELRKMKRGNKSTFYCYLRQMLNILFVDMSIIYGNNIIPTSIITQIESLWSISMKIMQISLHFTRLRVKDKVCIYKKKVMT